MNSAIIVAAGSGARFGTKTPKQFLEILGKPLIIYTLERFEACPEVNQMILVLPPSETSKFVKSIGKYSLSKLVRVVKGGKTRAESVLNGLKAIAAAGAEIIAVHDGARPLVTTEEISLCILKAHETGAAILVAAVTDTIKEVSSGKIVRTIDRMPLRRALTPQCFRYEILKRAFENADLSEMATDESFLVEKLDIEVSVVEGSAKNIKMTTEADFRFVESLLKETNV